MVEFLWEGVISRIPAGWVGIRMLERTMPSEVQKGTREPLGPHCFHSPTMMNRASKSCRSKQRVIQKFDKVNQEGQDVEDQ